MHRGHWPELADMQLDLQLVHLHTSNGWRNMIDKALRLLRQHDVWSDWKENLQLMMFAPQSYEILSS